MASTTKTGIAVAAKVLRCRTKAGLTQKQAAERSGLSISYISMLERAQREPSFTALETLAKLYDTTVAKLVA